MTEKLKQTIKEEVGKLTKENQDVINVFGWENIAEEVGKKNLLIDEEINDLQVETLLVLVGLQDPDEYAENVENNVGTSKNEAEKIASEVMQKIFTPISEKILEKIKKSDKIKNATTEQNLNFILSGGDYSAFLDSNSPLEEYPLGGGGNTSTPSSKLATPQEGNNTADTVLPVFFIKK